MRAARESNNARFGAGRAPKTSDSSSMPPLEGPRFPLHGVPRGMVVVRDGADAALARGNSDRVNAIPSIGSAGRGGTRGNGSSHSRRAQATYKRFNKNDLTDGREYKPHTIKGLLENDIKRLQCFVMTTDIADLDGFEAYVNVTLNPFLDNVRKTNGFKTEVGRAEWLIERVRARRRAARA